MSGLRATVRDADVHLTRVLDRARRAWLLGRIRLLAYWRRTTVDLDVAPDLRLGRGVVVKVAPRTHLRIRIGPKCRIGDHVHLYLTGGTLDWEEDVQLRVRSALDLAGELRCESRVIFSYGCIIHCVDSIHVGQLTAFAEYVTITDSAHYHSDPETHVTENTSWAPIVIGQNVFVAPRAQVNRGVTIGDYAIVGPNSVVVKDVPGGVFVSGIPAKVVRDPDLPWEREGG